jgi:hypothetical protein
MVRARAVATRSALFQGHQRSLLHRFTKLNVQSRGEDQRTHRSRSTAMLCCRARPRGSAAGQRALRHPAQLVGHELPPASHGRNEVLIMLDVKCSPSYNRRLSAMLRYRACECGYSCQCLRRTPMTSGQTLLAPALPSSMDLLTRAWFLVRR